MRDPELLVSLLREMAEQPDGRIRAIVHLSMSESERKRKFHIELLTDVGLVEWYDINKFPRITNAGFDFIEAIDKKKGAWEKFIEVLDTGAPLLNAVSAVADLFN